MNDKTRVENIDCMIRMRETPDKFYELAIVDPPYGIGASKYGSYGTVKKRFTEYKKKDWDENIPTTDYFIELFRVSKNQIIWGGHYFGIGHCEKWIIWDKIIPDGCDFGEYELAWTSDFAKGRIFRLSSSWNNGGNTKDLSQLQKPRRIHPTQKPVKLYKWLLKNYAKEGDKILDTHGGSMSSVIACLDMGYSITCYELDPDYYTAGKNRITNHLNQLNAFRPAYDIEFHDNSGVSRLRNQQGIGYQEQKNGENTNPIHRIDGLFHGDPAQ